MATFAERFAEALRIRHISAAELSRKLNISEGTLSQYKKGAYEPKQKRTEAIANELRVSIPCSDFLFYIVLSYGGVCGCIVRFLIMKFFVHKKSSPRLHTSGSVFIYSTEFG